MLRDTTARAVKPTQPGNAPLTSDSVPPVALAAKCLIDISIVGGYETQPARVRAGARMRTITF